MFRHRLRAPSPAFVISLIALFLALGGTSYAATKVTLTKHKDAKADTTLVKRLAPSLSVKHAKTADNATNAVSATNAVNATHATSADSATNATNATNATDATHATNATNATTAQTANVANAIGAVTYVKGTVRDAPANGGSGYAESTESDAFCPAGTVVIGTASHSNDQGVEVSELLVATSTQVSGFFDNFNNIDEPNNFVIAICAAVASVSDPSGFTPTVITR
jgi:cytoskeletal protein RodZ